MIYKLILTSEELSKLIRLVSQEEDLSLISLREKLISCKEWADNPEKESVILNPEEQSKRAWWLDIIKSAKKHLEKPRKGGDGYFLPPAEKVIAVAGLSKLKQEFFNSFDFRALMTQLQGRLNAERKLIRKLKKGEKDDPKVSVR